MTGYAIAQKAQPMLVEKPVQKTAFATNPAIQATFTRIFCADSLTSDKASLPDITAPRQPVRFGAKMMA
ncbi:hypothetical protein O7A70_33525 [Mesorhizobium sp. Cs1299R1N1]|uniref:hypothetical protein n=1 Tax=Mesorhizobium sp. Cs1299R1N1 TaxID=3015172 RepID=UPI00301D36B1